MRRRTGSAPAGSASVAAIVLAAAFVFPGPAQADVRSQQVQTASASSTNAMYTTLLGVPPVLPAGGTMDLTLNMHWESLDAIGITGLGISMWGSVPGVKPTQGISILWQDPQTGAWRGSDRIDAESGFWSITEPKGAVIIQAGGTLSVHLQITMADTAAIGIEHINAGKFDFDNTDDSTLPKGHVAVHDAQLVFTFGSALDSGSGDQPTPSASPVVSSSPVTVQTPSPAPKQVTAMTSSPATVAIPLAAMGNPATPRPEATASPGPLPLSRTQSPDTITEANIPSSGVNAVSAFGVILVMMAFLAGSALVIVRSRRSGNPPNN
jgi:hypothetical protein